MTNLIIVMPTVILLLLLLIALFNALVKKKNRVKNAWADIDVQLKRRYDLVPNLVEVVKGYKNYEASVLEKVTKARTESMKTTNLSDKAKSETMLSGALKNLFAVAENYPDLKSSKNFRKLQDELTSLENDIQSARRYYNASVRELNNATQTFPSNLIAKLFAFKPGEFFGAEEVEKSPVKINLK